MHKIAVFVGPSLDVGSAHAVLEATYLPPIKRGSLSQLSSEFTTIAIVDGEFYQSLAVSPKEILDLLGRGVRIFGASSIGALRAAETHSYGMVGIGRIFEMYRDGVIDADDEVALAYEAETYRSCSDPLINIRCALKEAQIEGLITSAESQEIIEHMKAVYFPLRSYELVCHLCPKIRTFLDSRRPNQKRDDALLLLRTLATSFGPQMGGDINEAAQSKWDREVRFAKRFPEWSHSSNCF